MFGHLPVMMSSSELAGYVGSGLVVSALSQYGNNLPPMTSSPTGFSEYIPSSSIASSPLRRYVNTRRKKRRVNVGRPYQAQKFIKRPSFFKFSK